MSEKIYTFNELSEQAKERARDWFREGGNSDDFEFVIEDAIRLGEMLGIEFSTHAVRLYGGGTRYEANIYWSGFCSQGDGASFEGTYHYKKGALKAIQAEAPAAWRDKDGAIHESTRNAKLHEIARVLQRAQAAHFYGITTHVKQSGRYVHENTMQFDHELTHPRTGDVEDYYESDATEQIEEALKSFAGWIYASLEAEYEYRTSDEYVDDTIIANDYEFDEDGGRI